MIEPVGSKTKPEDLPSLREIFDEHARYICRALRQLGVADADVEDQCQEVFLTVHRKLAEFEGRSRLRTWIYGICLRLASDYRRKAHVRREKLASDPGSLALLPEAQEAPTESRERLRRLLDLLDEERREVFVLYESEGFSMREVAEIVGCPLQTAYSRLYSARELLKSALQAEGSQ